LRDQVSPFNIVDSATSVLDTNGMGRFYFNNAFSNIPYYIVIKHRNSIETWSSQTVSFVFNEMSYDFTTSASQAFGNNLILKGTKYCLFSGDVNQDGAIDLSDMTMIDNDVKHFATGYIATDLNGDLSVTIDDMTMADNNSFNYVFAENPLITNAQTEQSSSNKNNKSSEKDKINSVKETKLHNPYPNPFNPSTSIKFELAKESFVKLKVYDITGREVATLVNEVKQPGINLVTFDGSRLSSGVYFYKIEAGNFTEIKKMTLIK
jgi:hypothetical protein